MNKLLSFLVVTILLVAVASAGAQQAPPPPPAYGTPISLEQAKKVMAGAEAEAKKNSWNVAIAIHDSGGNLVMLQRLDGTQFGSTDVAKDKAYSAVAFRRPTKAFQDLIEQGSANRHRGWKRHPAGGSSGLGTSPASVTSSRGLSRSMGSAAANSAFVYGCCGSSATASASPHSTILPRYMTAILWLMWATAARSWAMKRYDTPRRCWRSRSRFRIWARIDTSSADTGSSSTTSFGSSASARAMAMRWRWPPENSCG